MAQSVKTLITVNDVMHAGACHDGTMRRYSEAANSHTALPVDVALKLCETDEDREWILKAAEMMGNGDGYGYGDGNGNGYGYGDGYGYGNGYGNGNGNGYGYGDGNGYGYGDGDGDGYGYGDGDGYGYGYGDGNGYGNGYGYGYGDG